MAGLEYIDGYRWIRTRLRADATLAADPLWGRVFTEEVPAKGADGKPIPYPLVIVEIYTAEPVRVNGGVRLFAPCRYLIRTIGQTDDLATIEPISERIATVLDGAQGAAGNSLIMSCVRAGLVPLPVETDAETGLKFRTIAELWDLGIKHL